MYMPKILFYVTRDIERALGLSLDTEGYFIISNSTPFSKQIGLGHPNVLLIEESQLLDTHELLNHKTVQDFIANNSQKEKANILVFKNTTTIEKICTEKNWSLINPSAKLSQTIEEKISQVEWLGELVKYLPLHKVELAKNIVFQDVSFDDMPFILQFNRAHTGLGTMLIDSVEQLQEIQNKFPDRPVRITKFIAGPMFTNNNVVTPHKTLIGNINYQITGIPPFTDNPFATIGNDWGLPHKILKEKHFTKYREIASAIGEKLRTDGWKGLFGIDVIYDPQTDDIFLIEINARQPASTTYESQLQQKQHISQKSITTFEAHLQSLLNLDLSDFSLIPVQDGAQIIQRVTDLSKQNIDTTVEKLKKLSFNLTLIPYPNTEPGTDLLRIQSPKSIMKEHMWFNTIGSHIQNSLPMNKRLLSFEALEVMARYEILPFAEKERMINCPYFNNRRSKVRAGLRVLIGKGTPKEIVEEAQLFALREKIDLKNLSEEDLKKFLVDHNLGIDCSAFAYYILAAEYEQRTGTKLSSKIFYPNRSFIRKLLIKLRPVENISVNTLSHEKNTHTIALSEVQPGDVVIIMNAGKEHNLNHILVIYKIEYSQDIPQTLYYTHSFQWSIDGKYNHGIKTGRIEITNIQKSLLEQKWTEAEKMDEENETYLRAREAEVLELKRLKNF